VAPDRLRTAIATARKGSQSGCGLLAWAAFVTLAVSLGGAIGAAPPSEFLAGSSGDSDPMDTTVDLVGLILTCASSSDAVEHCTVVALRRIVTGGQCPSTSGRTGMSDFTPRRHTVGAPRSLQRFERPLRTPMSTTASEPASRVAPIVWPRCTACQLRRASACSRAVCRDAWFREKPLPFSRRLVSRSWQPAELNSIAAGTISGTVVGTNGVRVTRDVGYT